MTNENNEDLSATGTAGTTDFSKIEDLCTDLVKALTNPDQGKIVLQRQTHLLDELLYQVMHKSLDNEKPFDEWLGMALRIQKQCVDTIKAGAAIDYMKVLASRMDTPENVLPHPLPPQTDEQSEGV